MRPRVGIHDFLNSKPIINPILHGLVETPFELIIDLPSRLADRFSSGELDIAMIPSVEYARIEEAVIIPQICIASLGRVDTVLLFSKIEIENIETVSVDPKSRTSVSMLEVLFHEKWGKSLSIKTGEEKPELMLNSADAGLVIGDEAFRIDRRRYAVYDLGELWYQHTRRSFTHAVLCAKKGERWDSAVEALVKAKETGLANLDLIARQESNATYAAGITSEKFLDYLTTKIFFDLGHEQIEGLTYFLRSAEDLGLVTRSSLLFY